MAARLTMRVRGTVRRTVRTTTRRSVGIVPVMVEDDEYFPEEGGEVADEVDEDLDDD